LLHPYSDMSHLYTRTREEWHWSLMMKSMLRVAALFSLIPIIVVTLSIPVVAFAADVTYSPVVIDEKGKVRDIIKGSIHLSNTSNRKVELYPYVNNVDTQEGQQAFQAVEKPEDREDSLANWIELSRGVIELSPGEEKHLPMALRETLLHLR
jgi:hypothetical protein